MEIVPAIIAAVVGAIGIYATGVVINAKIKPLNMRTFRIYNVIVPIIVFAAIFIIMNFIVGSHCLRINQRKAR